MSTGSIKKEKTEKRSFQEMAKREKQKYHNFYQCSQTQQKIYSPIPPSDQKEHRYHQRQKINSRFEEWSSEEVKFIFQTYEKIGSQWKLYVNWLPERTSNSIKNRFYTAIRNTLKCIFREHSEIPMKLPHEIPSRDLLRLYEGKESRYFVSLEFSQFKGTMREIMIQMGYSYEIGSAKKIIEQYGAIILRIYHSIFQGQTHSNQQRDQKNRSQNEESEKKENQNVPSPENAQTLFIQNNQQMPMQNYMLYPNNFIPYQPVYYYYPFFSN